MSAGAAAPALKRGTPTISPYFNAYGPNGIMGRERTPAETTNGVVSLDLFTTARTNHTAPHFPTGTPCTHRMGGPLALASNLLSKRVTEVPGIQCDFDTCVTPDGNFSCSVDLRSTTAVGDPRYNRARKTFMLESDAMA